MLTSVHIHQFRSCSDVRIDNIGSMLVLLGRNGVGKTNVLRAVEWAAQVGSSITGEIAERASATGNVTLRMQLDGRSFEYWLSIELVTPEQADPDRYIAPVRVLNESLTTLQGENWLPVFHREGTTVRYGSHMSPLEIAAGSPAAFALASLVPNDPVTAVITTVMTFLIKVRYLPLDTPSYEEEDYGIVRENEFVAWKSRGSRPNADIKQLHMQLVDLKKNRPDRFEEFLKLVGDSGLGVVSRLSIEAFPFPLDGGKDGAKEIYHFIRWAPEQGGDSTWHSFGDLSYGTRRLLRLFVALLHEQPSVLLIEQPEDGIHKGLLHKLIPALESYCEVCQLFVATHAADILNRAQPEQIRLVNMSVGETFVRKLSEEELGAAHSFLAEEGGLADFLDLVEN